ncbi:MAG TPA: hypothetical protein DIS73_08200, partial [Planctomycetia bacterium]|nr:hypothetical protein [Planctomycetia bacterium]
GDSSLRSGGHMVFNVFSEGLLGECLKTFVIYTLPRDNCTFPFFWKEVGTAPRKGALPPGIARPSRN